MEKPSKNRIVLGLIAVLAGLLCVTIMFFTQGGSLAGAAIPHSCVPGPHTGVITGTQEWCAIHSPHMVTGDVTVPEGMILTVESGVVVKGDQNVELLVEGHLEALGTPSEPITFTSSVDPGGDPHTSRWSGVVFDGGTGNLRYATVLRGGEGNSTGMNTNITVRETLAGEVVLENCQVLDNYNVLTPYERGFYIDNGRVTIHDTLFSGNGDSISAAPLYITGTDSYVTLTGNTFVDNSRNRIVLAPGAMMGHDATLAAQTVLQGYELDGDYTVPPPVTLTLGPGVQLMGPSDVELLVEGHLEALGTPSEPIILTSLADSGKGQWSGVVFDGGTGHLRHVDLRYGGQGNSVGTNANITIQNTHAGEIFLENSHIHDSSSAGLRVVDGRAAVEGATFTDSAVNIHVTGASTVLLDNAMITSATSHGVLVEGDDAWVQIVDSAIQSNGAFGGDGVRNTGEAKVILSGDADEGNFIAYNQDYGANQTGLTGQIIATYNYWGDPSGPMHAGNPGGTGEAVSDRVLYEPWLTQVPTETLSVDDLVQVVGPLSVSPGEMVNLGFIAHNVLTKTLENALLVASLPQEVDYLLSWPAGNYWQQRQQVVWLLGDLAPGDVVHVAVQVRYQWGLAAHLQMHVRGLVSADNLQNPLIDHDLYAAYEPVTVTQRTKLSPSELDAELAADSDLQALYDQALAEGFTYFDNAYNVTQSTGGMHLEIVFLPDAEHYGETLVVLRIEGLCRVMRTTPDTLMYYDLDGGYEFNIDTREHWLWGTWAEGADNLASCAAGGPYAINECIVDETTCLRNCLVSKLGSDAAQILIPMFGTIMTAGDCAGCAASGFKDSEDCGSCASNLAGKLGADYLSLLNNLGFCGWQCRYNQSFREEQVCSQNETWCSTGWDLTWDFGNPRPNYVPMVMQRVCNTENCVWIYGEERKDWCEGGEICIQSPTVSAQCCNPLWDPMCLCMGGVCNDHPHEILTAGDPNEMYGPQAATPGETISYTIACENVGEGTAYGVYIDSVLPEGVDESTLKIGGGGVYYPTTRKLFWNIGELAPSAGDQVTFTVQIPLDAASDTVLVAKATVHFPSVPETTPTNEVVTLVGDVVGYPQQLVTTEGVATSITLNGRSLMGNPLTYTIVRQPLNGNLTGTAPALTYTPADNFEGLDSFAFQVSDGVHASLPAEVTIEVATGTETMPPQVVFTVPRDGANDVVIYDTPVYTDTYMPVVWAMFTEPINAATVTTASFLVTDEGGDPVDGVVVYDGTMNIVRFFLVEPLHQGVTYTARLTTAIFDTSGNPMASDFVWSFSSGAYRIYLPLGMQGY